MTAPLYDLTDTWNNGATVFTAIKMNVTDSASAAASLLIDLQVGSTSKFSIDKGGNVAVPADTGLTVASSAWYVKAAPNYVLASFYYWSQSLYAANTPVFATSTAGVLVPSDRFYSWTDGGTTGAVDLSLFRDAAGILAQRNGVNAQSFRFFETYTDAANNSMLRLDACKTTAGAHRIMSEANGTGTLRIIALDGFSKAGAAANTDLPSGTWALVHDTSGATTKLVYNDGGTLRTVALV